MLKAFLIKSEIQPMSVYEVSFNYTSKQSVCVEILLLSVTRHLLSKSTKSADLEIGSHSTSL